MSKLFLGLDTSAYTTSVAVVDEYNNIVFESREILKVKENTNGLRQQDAVFQHLNNLPRLIDKLSNSIDINLIHTISVSSKPRNEYSSYMPVFVVGKNQAFILSKVLNTPFKEFSHQEGHIAAGLLTNPITNDKFISLHISGGTTELLLVENKEDNIHIDIIGGALDINFGQLIDRIGVYSGYGFPCGGKMEEDVKDGKLIPINIPISIKDGSWCNISGLENYFIKLILSSKYDKKDIIFTLFHTIGRIIEKLMDYTVRNYEIKDILITGGVSANSFIRSSITKGDLNIYYPLRELSTDNGIGTAFLGKIKNGHRW